MRIKDPGSFLTHYPALMASVFAMAPLLYRVAAHPGKGKLLAFLAFSLSFILLYGASSLYHFVDAPPKINRLLKKIDHIMIFVMIMGSYTPVCLVALGDRAGHALLFLVYGIAALGMLMNACWIYCPKWLSSAIYIALGWVCLSAIVRIRAALGGAEFCLLVAGGVIYTIGGVIYAMKLPILKHRFAHFGNHEIFHLFVVAGSACHYAMMLLLAGRC